MVYYACRVGDCSLTTGVLMTISRERLFEIYDKAACAVYDAADLVKDEKTQKILDTSYETLAALRAKYEPQEA